jgi:hypothetical protein
MLLLYKYFIGEKGITPKKIKKRSHLEYFNLRIFDGRGLLTHNYRASCGIDLLGVSNRRKK